MEIEKITEENCNALVQQATARTWKALDPVMTEAIEKGDDSTYIQLCGVANYLMINLATIVKSPETPAKDLEGFFAEFFGQCMSVFLSNWDVKRKVIIESLKHKKGGAQ